MHLRRDFIKIPLAGAAGAALAAGGLQAVAQQPPVSLLNVSYDPTRELYVEINQAFQKAWKPGPARTSPSGNRMAARDGRRGR